MGGGGLVVAFVHGRAARVHHRRVTAMLRGAADAQAGGGARGLCSANSTDTRVLTSNVELQVAEAEAVGPFPLPFAGLDGG